MNNYTFLPTNGKYVQFAHAFYITGYDASINKPH